MRKKFYFSFFILLSIASQGIGDLSEDNREENIEKSSTDILVRKKRVIDRRESHWSHSLELQQAVACTGSLERYKQHICGVGYLLKYVVITAVQCVHGYKPEAFRVKAGSANIKDGDKHDVKRIFEEGDIALLIIAGDLEVRDRPIRPLNLASCDPEIESSLIVSGWGKENSYGLTSHHQELQAATVRVSGCPFPDTARYICTQDLTRENLVKFGPTDVGGPVFTDGVLFGIHLRGGDPAVHAKISNPDYRAFIVRILNQITYPPPRLNLGPVPAPTFTPSPGLEAAHANEILNHHPQYPQNPHQQYPPNPYPQNPHQQYPPNPYPQNPHQQYPPNPYPQNPHQQYPPNPYQQHPPHQPHY